MSTDVLELVRDWAAAEERGDATALGELLDDDFRGVGPVGFVLDRPAWQARFAGGLTNDAFAIEKPSVRVFGDTAVVVGVLAQQTHFGEHENSGQFRITIVTGRGSSGDLRILNVHIGGLQDPAAGQVRGADRSASDQSTPGPSAPGE